MSTLRSCLSSISHPIAAGLLSVAALVALIVACNGGGPPAAFMFDSGTQGFTFDGIYDGGRNVQVATCASPDSVFQTLPFHSPSVNYSPPGDTAESGSLLVFMAVPNCFPSDTAAVSTGFVRYGLLSPNLESNSSWQGIDGFTFRVLANIPGIQVQPLAHVTKPDGSQATFRPVDTNGQPVFTPIAADGTWHEVRFDLPEEEVTLRQIEARVFIEMSVAMPQYPANEASLNLDAVQSFGSP